METVNNFSNKKKKAKGIALHINLTAIAIFAFALFITFYKSFALSLSTGVGLLIFSIFLLIFCNFFVTQRGLLLTNADLMWMSFVILLILNSYFHNILNSSTLIDIFVYVISIIFLILVKVDINSYGASFKLIKIAGIIYALSAIFQYIAPNIYINYILPLFSSGEQITILQLLSANSYTGFTSQTAYLAGYIVSGIGLVIFSNWKVTLSNRIVLILSLSAMFIGLILTTKRAHLIFLIIALLVTILFSINSKIFIRNVIKFMTSVLVIVAILIILYTTFNLEKGSLLTGLISEINDTFYGIIEGEDITSGRSILYVYAWHLFTKYPLFGIGWEEFRNSYSLGLINNDVGSHPHNIYLQLLTELGIIGFFSFMIPLIYIYYITYRLLRKLSVNYENLYLRKWKYAVQYSFYYQTFFILYGITGNLLADYTFILMYFLVCSISLSAQYILNKSPSYSS